MKAERDQVTTERMSLVEIVHKLRGSAAAIGLLSESLAELPHLNDSQRRAIAALSSEGQSLTLLIDDLLAVAGDK